ncbi:hypothetical protein LXL04_003907 [Taraxacum kok-saghyz]
MDFEIGTCVEVIQHEEGLQGSYFVGVELISYRRLHPPPTRFDARLTIGDVVDAWHNDGWWVGRYICRERDNYIVVFDNTPGEEFSYGRRHIRFHHEWSAVRDRNDQPANCWLMIKR